MKKAYIPILIAAIAIILFIVFGRGLFNQDSKLEQINCPEDKEELNQFASEAGINLSEYNIISSECNMNRGGYMKFKLEKNNNLFDLYYHWGWCSSGGADCGWTECFKSYSSNDDYQKVKNYLCQRADSYQIQDGVEFRDGGIVQAGCPGPYFDNKTEVQQKCSAGDFEQKEGNTTTISINEDGGRCHGSAENGSFSCLSIKPPY